MANNVAMTQGTGTDFATDDVGGVHYPYVKIAFGSDNTATIASTSDPFPISDAGGSITVDAGAGENHVGEVGGNSTVITPTVTVTAGAYSAGDVIGGRITLTNAMRITSGTGVWQDLFITTADGETPELWALLFDSTTASSISDNAAFAWGAGDHAKCLAAVHIAAADWLTIGSDGVLHKQNLGIVVAANGSQNLYAYLVAVGTPTFGATSDVVARFKFLRD